MVLFFGNSSKFCNVLSLKQKIKLKRQKCMFVEQAATAFHISRYFNVDCITCTKGLLTFIIYHHQGT